MGARDSSAPLAPEGTDNEIIVSKNGLAQLRRRTEQAEARAREIERRKVAELRRRLRARQKPNVPLRVRNPSPGYARIRPLHPPDRPKAPGPKLGHDGTTRQLLTPNRRIGRTADRWGKCHGPPPWLRGAETEQEIEIERERAVKEQTVGVYDYLDCGETVRATLPDGRAPAGYGPELRTKIVFGKIEERLPYRKLEERLERDRMPHGPATPKTVVGSASEIPREEDATILR